MCEDSLCLDVMKHAAAAAATIASVAAAATFAAAACPQQGHSGYHLAPYIPPFDSMENRWCCNAPLEALEWMLVQQVGSDKCTLVLMMLILIMRQAKAGQQGQVWSG
jgi:hypothetical protein